MSITPDASAGRHGAPHSAHESIAWLLQEFTDDLPDVTHAVLLSREGLRLLDGGVEKDWADQLAAAISGVASIAANVTGPTGQNMPAKQVLIERDDCLLLVQNAGGSKAFENQPGAVRGVVDTILVVVTVPDANVNTVAFEMSRLIGRFADYMEVPVRAASGDVAP
ncbi:roadblock/LC7 domain-containing protein [Streptomyces sp. NPDC006658]|uniref:roadblock/LC7 domain-containing protein n=1 Tax=Streptomyces sp. NPDC006658 TaxID=3156900 RepID=UPI00340D528A